MPIRNGTKKTMRSSVFDVNEPHFTKQAGKDSHLLKSCLEKISESVNVCTLDNISAPTGEKALICIETKASSSGYDWLRPYLMDSGCYILFRTARDQRQCVRELGLSRAEKRKYAERLFFVPAIVDGQEDPGLILASKFSAEIIDKARRKLAHYPILQKFSSSIESMTDTVTSHLNDWIRYSRFIAEFANTHMIGRIYILGNTLESNTVAWSLGAFLDKDASVSVLKSRTIRGLVPREHLINAFISSDWNQPDNSKVTKNFISRNNPDGSPYFLLLGVPGKRIANQPLREWLLHLTEAQLLVVSEPYEGDKLDSERCRFTFPETVPDDLELLSEFNDSISSALDDFCASGFDISPEEGRLRLYVLLNIRKKFQRLLRDCYALMVDVDQLAGTNNLKVLVTDSKKLWSWQYLSSYLPHIPSYDIQSHMLLGADPRNSLHPSHLNAFDQFTQDRLLRKIDIENGILPSGGQQNSTVFEACLGKVTGDIKVCSFDDIATTSGEKILIYVELKASTKDYSWLRPYLKNSNYFIIFRAMRDYMQCIQFLDLNKTERLELDGRMIFVPTGTAAQEESDILRTKKISAEILEETRRQFSRSMVLEIFSSYIENVVDAVSTRLRSWVRNSRYVSDFIGSHEISKVFILGNALESNTLAWIVGSALDKNVSVSVLRANGASDLEYGENAVDKFVKRKWAEASKAYITKHNIAQNNQTDAPYFLVFSAPNQQITLQPVMNWLLQLTDARFLVVSGDDEHNNFDSERYRFIHSAVVLDDAGFLREFNERLDAALDGFCANGFDIGQNEGRLRLYFLLNVRSTLQRLLRDCFALMGDVDRLSGTKNLKALVTDTTALWPWQFLVSYMPHVPSYDIQSGVLLETDPLNRQAPEYLDAFDQYKQISDLGHEYDRKYEASNYLDFQPSTIDFSNSLLSGKTICIVQKKLDETNITANQLLKKNDVVYISYSIMNLLPEVRANGRYICFDENNLYLDEGHSMFNGFVKSIASAVKSLSGMAGILPFFGRSLETICFDKRYTDLFCLTRLQDHLTKNVKNIVVFSNDAPFLNTVMKIARVENPDISVITPLYKEKRPEITDRQIRHTILSGRRGRSQEANEKALAFLNRNKGEKCALIVGTARNVSYFEALVNTAIETLAKRPVMIVLASSIDTEKLQVFERQLEKKAIAEKSRYCVMLLADLSNATALNVDVFKNQLGVTGRVFEALESYRLKSGDALKYFTLANLSFNLTIGIISKHEWITKSIDSDNCAYGIIFGARTFHGTLFTDVLGDKNIATIDPHVFTHANSARQLATRTKYLGVIDSEQEDFFVKHWGTRRDNMIRIGYLRNSLPDKVKTETKAKTKTTVSGALGKWVNGRKVILVATQPGPIAFGTDMLDCLFQESSMLPDHAIIVKMHPREKNEDESNYNRHIAVHEMAHACCVVRADVDIYELLPASSLLVTRTSNVGLEAAILGIPVLRYLANDQFLAPAFLQLPYALNTQTHAEAIVGIRSLLREHEAKNALALKQEQYLSKNPALYHMDGCSRLASFMERCILPDETP